MLRDLGRGAMLRDYDRGDLDRGAMLRDYDRGAMPRGMDMCMCMCMCKRSILVHGQDIYLKMRWK